MSSGTAKKTRAVVTSGRSVWPVPWVQMRTYSFSPTIFPAMIAGSSPGIAPGSWVSVYDKEGRHFGNGWFNPRARIPLRVIYHGEQPVGEEFADDLLDRAVAWREDQLRLNEYTDAYRVVNSDGDGLSGLIVDRYADVLSVEVHSLAVWQRLGQWLPRLHQRLGTKREVVQVDERSARNEGIPSRALEGGRVLFRENGLRFEVVFDAAHKTGFFVISGITVDGLARWCRDDGRWIYVVTRGFAVAAAVWGGARDVTGVDLDEAAIAQARRNGNLNQQNRIRWVHADAFSYARQMYQNGERWGAIVLDPPKFLESREEMGAGMRKYADLNTLAIQLVEPGGLFVTCSCSGLWTMEEFEAVVIRAAHRLNRRLQIFDRTGAGPDHPVLSNCLESRYLKVLWARVW